MSGLFIARRAAIGHDGSRRIIADGTPEDAKALADLVRAGRKAWAATSHPEPLTIPCPRCEAAAGTRCSTAGGTILPWGHRERHKAAIEADGRTCTAEEES